MLKKIQFEVNSYSDREKNTLLNTEIIEIDIGTYDSESLIHSRIKFEFDMRCTKELGCGYVPTVKHVTGSILRTDGISFDLHSSTYTVMAKNLHGLLEHLDNNQEYISTSLFSYGGALQTRGSSRTSSNIDKDIPLNSSRHGL